jgi:hypothetical protein
MKLKLKNDRQRQEHLNKGGENTDTFYGREQAYEHVLDAIRKMILENQ